MCTSGHVCQHCLARFLELRKRQAEQDAIKANLLSQQKARYVVRCQAYMTQYRHNLKNRPPVVKFMWSDRGLPT